MAAEPSGAEKTRQALIRSALRLFAAKGYAGASTREIAGDAGANLAAIGYHFGGKAGLRAACVAAIAERVGDLVATVERESPESAAAAAAQLEAAMRAVVGFMVAQPDARDMAAFLLRMITAEADAPIEDIYRALILPRHQWLCTLWGQATGTDPESETVKIAVFAMIGQIIYFNIGAPVVRRRMDWGQIGPAEGARIAEVLVGNLHAALRAFKDRG